MREIKISYWILAGKRNEKTRVSIFKRRWGNIIWTAFKKLECEGVVWTLLGQIKYLHEDNNQIILVPSLLWNPNFHYRVSKSTQSGPILDKLLTDSPDDGGIKYLTLR